VSRITFARFRSSRQAITIAQLKMLHGSDWPVLSPERWEREFAQYDFPDDALRKIMRDDAAKLLGLAELIGSQEKPATTPSWMVR
jgi:predicted TIM-barrel fold metal-dependent hydrolase